MNSNTNNKRFKQTDLKNCFKRIDPTQACSLDAVNVSHLIALDTMSNVLTDQDLENLDGACSTWNRSRTVAVDAAKAQTKATFYREAPGENLIEYWCFGLEKTPGYLMKLVQFHTALHELRKKHAKDIMCPAADQSLNYAVSLQKAYPTAEHRDTYGKL